MKRREFVTAGLAALGAVGLSSDSSAAPSQAGSSDSAAQVRAGSASSWDGNVRTSESGAEASGAQGALAAELTALVAPLRGGSVLSESTLREVYVDESATGVAIIENGSGRIARLDVCRRDGETGVEPLATTAGYEIFVRNGADGDRATERETILAARALAEVIGRNESSRQLALVSKPQYWRAEGRG